MFPEEDQVPPPERESTRPGAGWWKEQMLVDRTLRVMAGLMTIFAVTLIVLCIVLAPKLAAHLKVNPHSSSVFIASGSRESMSRRCEVRQVLSFMVHPDGILGTQITDQRRGDYDPGYVEHVPAAHHCSEHQRSQTHAVEVWGFTSGNQLPVVYQTQTQGTSMCVVCVDFVSGDIHGALFDSPSSYD